MENNSSHSSPETENSQEVDVYPFIIESNTPVHTLNLTLQPQPDESVISTQASEPQKNQAIENNDAKKIQELFRIAIDKLRNRCLGKADSAIYREVDTVQPESSLPE
ncbi:unnamed protein product [Parnassius apollo]|uniref:(apollo) hypothetical protein n=1 Tax=Parnassius apollo TaxID=110799 RepID=A0A8S3X1D2_PARAO|nr:unnamed protein product [Parnassius apollo]